MSDAIQHECGLAFIRLRKPFSYYLQKYGTVLYGLNKLYLLMEKQHNRGQDGAGVASVKLNIEPGHPFLHRIRSANNHQSGSDYRILGTTSIIRGTGAAQVIYPVFLGDGTTIIQWNPIPILSQGSNFRTHGLFYNDSWRVNGRLTANLGVRFDKNHGLDQEGKLVTTSGTFSPRLGVIVDPFGDQIDRHGQFFALFGENEPRQPIAVRVLLPIHEVLCRRHGQRVAANARAAMRRRPQAHDLRSDCDGAVVRVARCVMKPDQDGHRYCVRLRCAW